MTTTGSGGFTDTSGVALAMDWGGTWARAAVIDREGRVLWQDRVANPPGATQDELVAGAGNLLIRAKSGAGEQTIVGVGIALAGSIDAATSMLMSSPNLPELDGVVLPELWQPVLGAPVWVGNDANLAALGEFHFGAGRAEPPLQRAARTLAYLTFSTGVGGGIVDRGVVFTGAVGAAGEIGHMTIDSRADAPACNCGNSGCLEAFASGTAIGRAAQVRLGDATPGSPLQQAYESEATVTSEAVFAAAARGDVVANEVVDAAVGAMIIGLANVVNIFNPDVVVIGGGVTRGLVSLGLVEHIEVGVLRRAMSSGHRAFRLAVATLGENEGMVGAASLVWSQFDQS